MKKNVFDSYAVLAYLYNERGSDQVEDILKHATHDKKSVYMSTVNWAEVGYIVSRKNGPKAWDHTRGALEQLPIQLIDADKAIAERAAEFKTKYSMSLADAFAAALSTSQKAQLITGDPEFKQVENQIKVLWL